MDYLYFVVRLFAVLVTMYLFSLCSCSDVICKMSKPDYTDENQVDSACLSCNTQKMRLVCAEDEVVTGHVRAGFRECASCSQDTGCMCSVKNDSGNITETCQIKPDDCISEPVLLLPAIYDCLWKKSTCDFTLANEDSPRDSKCSKSVCLCPLYLLATDLQCVKRSNLKHICQDNESNNTSVYRDEVTYISSVGFPMPYSQNTLLDVTSCQIKVTSPHNQGINISLLAMDLPDKVESKTCKEDYISIIPSSDLKEPEIKWCGAGTANLHIPASQILIGLNVNRKRKRNTYEGFLMKLQAVPKIQGYSRVTEIQVTDSIVKMPFPSPVADVAAVTLSTTSQQITADSHTLTAVILCVIVTSVALLTAIICLLVIKFSAIRQSFPSNFRRQRAGDGRRRRANDQYFECSLNGLEFGATAYNQNATEREQQFSGDSFNCQSSGSILNEQSLFQLPNSNENIMENYDFKHSHESKTAITLPRNMSSCKPNFNASKKISSSVNYLEDHIGKEELQYFEMQKKGRLSVDNNIGNNAFCYTFNQQQAQKIELPKKGEFSSLEDVLETFDLVMKRHSIFEPKAKAQHDSLVVNTNNDEGQQEILSNVDKDFISIAGSDA